MLFRIIIFLGGVVLLCGADLAKARMYQWRSPDTGTLQASGNPPAWYRSGAGGPRVWVYDGGYLIDDTAIAVPPEQAEKLRGSAFEELQARQRAERLKRLERVAKRAELRQRADRRKASLAAETKTDGDTATSAAEGGSEADLPLDPSMIGRLKDLIRDFDRQDDGASR